MILEFSPRAEGDVDDIATFIAKDNPSRAIAFLDQLASELQRIEASPLHYQLRRDIGSEARLAVVGRHVILFRVLAQTIRIERVVHGSRLLPPLLQ